MEFTGDRDRLVELTEQHPDLRSYDVSTAGDATFTYSRIIADEELLDLYRIPTRHDIVLDTPMRYTDRGALRARAIGTQSAIAAAVGDIPDGLRPKFIGTGDYDPDRTTLGDMLTERQREILRTAIEMGYYEESRETNYAELAAELDLASGTVGEHLRKIESTVLKGVLP